MQRTPAAPLMRKPLGGKPARTPVVLLSLSVGCLSQAGMHSRATPAVAPPPALTLHLALAAPGIVTSNSVAVEWQLRNLGQQPVYICEWPGIAFSRAWDCPNGSEAGDGPGYPDSRTLARSYFRQLGPGESLIAHTQVDLWPTPTGKLLLRAEFRSDQDGREYGLSAWKGTISSAWILVDVPRDETSNSCEK